jgi:hypothetical protein
VWRAGETGFEHAERLGSPVTDRRRMCQQGDSGEGGRGTYSQRIIVPELRDWNCAK